MFLMFWLKENLFGSFLRYCLYFLEQKPTSHIHTYISIFQKANKIKNKYQSNRKNIKIDTHKQTNIKILIYIALWNFSIFYEAKHPILMYT